MHFSAEMFKRGFFFFKCVGYREILRDDGVPVPFVHYFFTIHRNMQST